MRACLLTGAVHCQLLVSWLNGLIAFVFPLPTDLTYFPTLPYFDMGNSSDSDNDGVNTEWEQQHVSRLVPPTCSRCPPPACRVWSA